MTPQAWPFEQPAEGTLRPWYLTATGYLEALFSDPEEAQRAQEISSKSVDEPLA